MASIITAGNATNNGASISSDNTGAIELKTGTGAGTTAITVDALQNVGIGTSLPGAKLEVVNTNGAQSGFGITNSGTTFVGMYNSVADSSGSVYRGVYYDVRNESGATVANMLVDVNTDGSSAWTWALQAAGTRTDRRVERLRIASNGALTSQPTYDNTAAGSTVVVTSTGLIRRTSSSIKYKKDVESLDAALVSNAVDNLRPVWYRTKNAEGDDKATWSHIGLIAEEVHEVEPRLVRYKTVEVTFDEEGKRVETELATPEPEDVDYARLSVLLLAEIKSLKARVEALEAK